MIEYIDEQAANDFDGASARRLTTQKVSHGRDETRTYIQMPVPAILAERFEVWKGLKSIGVVISDCIRNGKATLETRYFISSLEVGVKRFARAVRGHWAIENSCHWSLDFTYREDESRMREECLRENFAWINRFTLSLLKQHPSKESVVMKRRLCGWNDSFMLEVLVGTAP